MGEARTREEAREDEWQERLAEIEKDQRDLGTVIRIQRS